MYIPISFYISSIFISCVDSFSFCTENSRQKSANKNKWNFAISSKPLENSLVGSLANLCINK